MGTLLLTGQEEAVDIVIVGRYCRAVLIHQAIHVDDGVKEAGGRALPVLIHPFNVVFDADRQTQSQVSELSGWNAERRWQDLSPAHLIGGMLLP